MKCVHAFGTGRHKRQEDMTLLFQYIYIYRYNAQLAISCLRGSVGRTREYCTLVFLSSASLVRIRYATLIIVTIEKTFVFYFY